MENDYLKVFVVASVDIWSVIINILLVQEAKEEARGLVEFAWWQG
jgi:hypothetical protein